jgi:hypothetical protein
MLQETPPQLNNSVFLNTPLSILHFHFPDSHSLSHQHPVLLKAYWVRAYAAGEKVLIDVMS